MNKIETFEKFLTTQSADVAYLSFTVNLILAAVLGYLLAHVYVKYGNSLSNRKQFAKNFIMMTILFLIFLPAALKTE